MHRILIAPTTFGTISNEPIKRLKNANCRLVFNSYKSRLNQNQLVNLASDCDGIIAGTEEYNKDVIKKLKKLKIISRLGVGIDNIDIKATKHQKIKLLVTQSSPSRSVAELAMGLILNILRKISTSDRNIRLGKWDKKMGNLLSFKSLGIIGLGKVGKELVKLLSSFGVKIFVYDKKCDEVFCKKYKCQKVSLNKLLSNSDIISIHINSTNKTKAIFDKKTFAMMKKNAILINTSRGSLINEEDLRKALKNKQIRGAALDVFNEEPYRGKLSNLDNILLTPHIGSYAEEIRLQMELESVENLIKNLTK